MVALALPGRAFTGRHSLPPRTHPAGHAWGAVSPGVAASQAEAQESTTYDYGQEGLAETARFLWMHPAAGKELVCMKDGSHLAGRRCYSTCSAILSVPEHTDAILGMLASGEERCAVFTQGRGQDNLGCIPARGLESSGSAGRREASGTTALISAARARRAAQSATRAGDLNERRL